MTRTTSFVGLFAIIFATFFAPPSFGITDHEKKTRLDLSLSSIELASRRERMTSGAMALGAAGIFGTLAVLSADSTDFSIRNVGPTILGASAGIFFIGGILSFMLPTEYETAPQSYQSLPSNTPELLKAKVISGENTLSHLASIAARQRLLSAITTGTLGTAELIWYFAEKGSNINQSFLLYHGILLVGVSMIPLFFEKEAETEQRKYLEWKNTVKISWTLSPGVSRYGSPALALSMRW